MIAAAPAVTATKCFLDKSMNDANAVTIDLVRVTPSENTPAQKYAPGEPGVGRATSASDGKSETDPSVNVSIDGSQKMALALVVATAVRTSESSLKVPAARISR